jgi:hypothetical protein
LNLSSAGLRLSLPPTQPARLAEGEELRISFPLGEIPIELAARVIEPEGSSAGQVDVRFL